MIKSYHEYKSIWNNPTLGEELECKREPGNPHDTHAVAVIKTISGSNVTEGHLPRAISLIDERTLVNGPLGSSNTTHQLVSPVTS